MHRYKEKENETDRKEIEAEFLEFSKTSEKYDQIRYIDKSGMELIRVDYFDGNSAIIPEEKLQDKSGRYYFKESIVLPENGIYISPFDLNVEKRLSRTAD